MMHRRPKELGVVVESLDSGDGFICLDLFERSDGSFGYEEYRRDPETREGWFPIGFHAARKFDNLPAAKADAAKRIGWYEEESAEMGES